MWQSRFSFLFAFIMCHNFGIESPQTNRVTWTSSFRWRNPKLTWYYQQVQWSVIAVEYCSLRSAVIMYQSSCNVARNTNGGVIIPYYADWPDSEMIRKFTWLTETIHILRLASVVCVHPLARGACGSPCWSFSHEEGNPEFFCAWILLRLISFTKPTRKKRCE